MKRLLTIVIVAGVILGGITYFLPTKITVDNEEPTVVEKEVEVEIEALQNRIDQAREAKEMEIEATAYKAYLETRRQLEKELELEVRRQYRKELEEMEAQLEEQVSL